MLHRAPLHGPLQKPQGLVTGVVCVCHKWKARSLRREEQTEFRV